MNHEMLKHTSKDMGNNFFTLIKWTIFSMILGLVIGTIASGFSYAVHYVTQFRLEHTWMLLGLPFVGLLIVYSYHITGRDMDTGTNQVLVAIRTNERIPLRLTPLILISTIITHAFGGSAGREGAALQFGGSIGNWIGERFHLSPGTRKIMIMAGMSAAFSALFGTPLGAAIFSIEVISVGVMYYAALVPCIFSAFTALAVAMHFGTQTGVTPYLVTDIPKFYSIAAVKPVVLGVACAIMGILFCLALKYAAILYEKFFPNRYIRIFVGGCLVALLVYLFGTQNYIGLGENVIRGCFSGEVPRVAFLWKILFTALTLAAGFKGGEIVPTLFIGATLGCSLSSLLALPEGLASACGMVGMFCAVTNSPVSTLLIAFELFGFQGMPYYGITIAVSYLLSDYYGLYKEQKIMYSKTDNVFIGNK